MDYFGEFVAQRWTDDHLQRKARQALLDIEGFRQYALQANARSIIYLRNAAAKYLEEAERATGRPGNTGHLRQVILSDKVHDFGYDGFDFALTGPMSEEAVYWRVIETGTRQFMNQRFPIAFQAGNGRFMEADRKRFRMDRAYRGMRQSRGGRGRPAGHTYGNPKGEAEGKQGWVLIKRPIEEHLYLRHAINQFNRTGMYARYMNTAAKRYERTLGLKVAAKAGV